MLLCFLAFITGIFGLKSLLLHLRQKSHPLYRGYYLLALWLIILSFLQGILLIPLLYWHCNVRDKEDIIFADFDIPFGATYNSHENNNPYDYEEEQKKKDYMKEQEHKRFRQTMK
jgi:hypothetical protein